MKGWELLGRLPLYKLYKHIEQPWVMPISYVYLVSYKCNSKCKTCGLWKIKPKGELSAEDWRRIIQSIGGSPVWVTITGGEPFCFPAIDRIAIEVLQVNRPRVLCIPSNGSLPTIIVRKLKQILAVRGNFELIVNLSVDDIGERHDALRGLKGGFEKLRETVARLRELQKGNQNLRIGMNTVISQYNIDHIFEIYHYVTSKLAPDDYIFETAQLRVELATTKQDFSIDREKLERFLKFLIIKQKRNLPHKHGVSFVKNAIRLKYYRHLLEPKRGKCNAGILSCQIMPDGRVVGCGVKAELIGRLTKHNLDFQSLWHSELARKRRALFRNRKCSCQLANIFYVNMI